MRYIIAIMLILLLISGCNSSSSNSDTSVSSETPTVLIQTELPTPTILINTPIQQINNAVDANKDDTKKAIKELSDKVADYLNKKDMNKLGSYVHPEKGVRFSQFGGVNIGFFRNFGYNILNTALNNDIL